MAIETTDSRGAHEALGKGDPGTLVDVRTVAEYDAGHPAGAVNVPWALRGPAGMSPNPDFLPTMQARYPKDARLYLSCQAGVRSLNACRELEAAGYADLVNVDGGFGGRRSPTGSVVVPGWADSGLPVEHDKSSYGQSAG